MQDWKSECEHAHGFEAEAGIAAGNEDDATAEVQPFGDVLGSRFCTELTHGQGIIDGDGVVTATAARQYGTGPDRSAADQQLTSVYVHRQLSFFY